MRELETAKVDFLTKCYTKETLAPVLEKLVIEDKTFDRHFSLLMLDVDHFKSFNDKYGHLYGDAVLKFFSSSLRLGLEETKVHVFRFGGDEFVVLFPGKDTTEVRKIANFLRYTLRKRPLLMGGKLFNMSFSGGICSSQDGKTPEDILACADKAMYVSKKHGRARSTIYTRIGLENAAHILMGVARVAIFLVVFVALAFYAFRLYFPKHSFFKVLQKHGMFIDKARVGTVLIRMKSGQTLKGVVVKERKDTIDLLLQLEQGEGYVTLKRSGIKEIVP